jgi:50S ribosomal protein L16 3-hydroxylase
MHRHWQKRPLLVRGALPGFEPLLSRAELFALAADEDVESRLVERQGRRRWRLAHGPFRRRALPALRHPNWTLLVQGVDLHVDAAHALLGAFRFVPDARLDDLMISWASNGGGVGPHFDSYDVFLLQAQGQRRWRIGRQGDLSLRADAPLKILRRFSPTEEHVLRAGDLLYLPPQWAHDGVAVGGECMTYSIGMRAPRRSELAAELAARCAERYDDDTAYGDPEQRATTRPAEIPGPLRDFATASVLRLLSRRATIENALGEWLSEPKANVWFEQTRAPWRTAAITLDPRTRMLYDGKHVYINGETVRTHGRDAALLRRLANQRRLDARDVRSASLAARKLLREWFAAGWLRATA